MIVNWTDCEEGKHAGSNLVNNRCNYYTMSVTALLLLLQLHDHITGSIVCTSTAKIEALKC